MGPNAKSTPLRLQPTPQREVYNLHAQLPKVYLGMLTMTTRISDRLCDVCAINFDNRVDTPNEVRGSHHLDYSSLEAAADADCYICVRIQRDVEAYQASRRVKANIGASRFEIHADIEALRRNLTISTHVEDDNPCQTRFMIFKKDLCQELGLQSTLPPSARSSRCMQMIVEWISTCRETHQNCQASSRARPKGRLPTRLLHLSQSSGADRLKLRLCYAADIASDVEYFSLSHAWARERFVTLNKDNHDDFMRDIPVMALPQSFQDAIYVTGALKCRYLWIDSLCIVQDDPGDWDKEFLRMADVYKNAALNLSASWTNASNNGFLVEQRSNNPIPVLVNWFGNSTEKSFVISESRPWESVWNSPLYTRAWVLQEQILAPRAVHFAQDQIHWECEDLYANEVMPLGVPTVEIRDIHEESSPSLRNHRRPPRNPYYESFSWHIPSNKFWHFSINNGKIRDRLFLYSTWMQIIMNFSKRKLTFDSDRLPALAGLASEFALVLKVESTAFMYGLWRHDLHRQLLWDHPIFSTDPKISRPKPSLPNWSSIPSWSWVPTNHPVGWGTAGGSIDRGFSPLCSILDRNIDVVAPNYALYIQGRPLKLIHYSPCDEARPWDLNVLVIAFLGMTCDLSFDTWYLQLKCDLAGDDYSHPPLLSVTSEILAMPLVCSVREYGYRICGLLLWRGGEALGPGMYRRVGVIEMACSNLEKAKAERVKGYREDLSDDEVVKRCENGSVVLCVV